MQHPKFPYDRVRCSISQVYGVDHRAWDIVPLYKRGDGLPADCYPVFSGQTIKIHDTDPVLGKGIRVKTLLWPDIKAYLKTFNIKGDYIEILYWHLLDVTDEDGFIDQHIPVGITGNTGQVYSQGKPVPDYLKGVPPYPGLHLHIEMKVGGRFIDPQIIFNYKPMSQIKTQKKGSELRVVLSAANWEEWIALAKVYGVDPNIYDETIN